MTLPVSSVISAVRRSHSTWSNGRQAASLKIRSHANDFRTGLAVGAPFRFLATDTVRCARRDFVVGKTCSGTSIMTLNSFAKTWAITSGFEGGQPYFRLLKLKSSKSAQGFHRGNSRIIQLVG